MSKQPIQEFSILTPLTSGEKGLPVIISKPHVARGEGFVGLSTDPQNPTAIVETDQLVWQFSCDTTSCSFPCMHSWQYREIGSQQWITQDAVNNKNWAWIANPALMMGAGTFEFRVVVADCNGQTAYSGTFYIDTLTPSEKGSYLF